MPSQNTEDNTHELKLTVHVIPFAARIAEWRKHRSAMGGV